MDLQRINQHKSSFDGIQHYISSDDGKEQVDDKGFGRIRSKGDTALFGGHTTEDHKGACPE